MLMTKESLFCLQRKPLFHKRGKSDFFYIEKFAISLFRSIFATETDVKLPLSV